MATIKFTTANRFEFIRIHAYITGVRIQGLFNPYVGLVNTKDKYPAKCNPLDPAVIVMPSLLLGSGYGSRDKKVVNFYGITHVLNMSRVVPYDPFDQRLTTLKINAEDKKDYNLMQHFEEAHQFIDEAILSGGRCLVHCSAGISRSATIVISYLMSRFNMSLYDAYNHVLFRRSRLMPNKSFISQLIQYEQELNFNRLNQIFQSNNMFNDFFYAFY